MNAGIWHRAGAWLLRATMVLGAVTGCGGAPVLDCAQQPQDRHHGNAGCLVVDGGRLLMVQQRITGLWALPGGTAEPGERAVCTAWRETREETGLEVRVGELLHRFDNGFRLYRCTPAEPQQAPSAAATGPGDALEIADLGWLDRHQISDHR